MSPEPRYIQDPYSLPEGLFDNLCTVLSTMGASVAAALVNERKISQKQMLAALVRASEAPERSALACSVLAVAQAARISIPAAQAIRIREPIVDEWEVRRGDPDLSGVIFDGAYIGRLEIDPDVMPARVPRFRGCSFQVVSGRFGEADLPGPDVFKDCAFEVFALSADNTARILDADMQPMVKAVCTCLEKLFLQPGRGRDESAFPRGLDGRLRALVPEALDLIRSERMAEPYRTNGRAIWVPDRAMHARVRSILTAPNASSDNLLRRAREVA